jgi:hypothetical protein
MKVLLSCSYLACEELVGVDKHLVYSSFDFVVLAPYFSVTSHDPLWTAKCGSELRALVWVSAGSVKSVPWTGPFAIVARIQAMS